MYLSTLTAILNAKLIGADAEIFGLATDSKAIKTGDIFIARRGANLDGHDYILEAKQNGAQAALVDHWLPEANLPQVMVADTSQALAKLGAWRRQQYAHCLLAVTGSCGKTTTKEMLAAILRNCAQTFVSAKSFNNIVGMPLTIWNLSADDQFAILELGANHHGEISSLVKLIKPIHVALITNAEPCHLEGFGSVAGVARAKGEIYEGLADDGVAIINADSPYHKFWLQASKQHRNITFGINNDAQITAKNVRFSANGNTDFTLILPTASIELRLPHSGHHNVMNALAAAAAATAVGAPATAIKLGLASFSPVQMRLCFREGRGGSKIIDDTYNANPTAVKSALAVLRDAPLAQKVFVFGGMRELGEQAEYWHRYVGKVAKEMGIDYLYVCGQYAAAVAEEFGERALAFHDQQELIPALLDLLDENKIVLVKGSRGAAMEKVVQAILSEP